MPRITPSSPLAASDDGGTPSSDGAVAGIVIAAIFVMTLISLIAVMTVRSKRRARERKESAARVAEHVAEHVTKEDDASEMA